MIWKEISIIGYKGLYKISEFGDVYSCRKNKLLKPLRSIPNKVRYYQYFLTPHSGRGKWFKQHRLVAIHYVSDITPGYEVNHKDLNKDNNHYSNLEYVTHRQNMIHARKRKNWYTNRNGILLSEETKKKMGIAKMKKVMAISEDQSLIFDSIQDLCMHFNTYPRKFNRIMESNKTLNGYSIEYYNP